MIVDALFYYLKFDAVFENLPKLGSEFCAHVAVLRVGFFVSAASFMNFKLIVDVLYNFLKFDAVFGKISKLGSEWSCVRDIFGLHVGFFGSAAGAISWWAVLKIVHKYAALFGQMTRKVAKYVAVFYKTSKLGAECYCARDFFGLHAWFFVIAAGGISRWAVLNKIHKFAAVIGKMTRKGIKFWFKAAGFGFFGKMGYFRKYVAILGKMLLMGFGFIFYDAIFDNLKKIKDANTLKFTLHFIAEQTTRMHLQIEPLPFPFHVPKIYIHTPLV